MDRYSNSVKICVVKLSEAGKTFSHSFGLHTHFHILTGLIWNSDFNSIEQIIRKLIITIHRCICTLKFCYAKLLKHDSFGTGLVPMMFKQIRRIRVQNNYLLYNYLRCSTFKVANMANAHSSVPLYAKHSVESQGIVVRHIKFL